MKRNVALRGLYGRISDQSVDAAARTLNISATCEHTELLRSSWASASRNNNYNLLRKSRSELTSHRRRRSVFSLTLRSLLTPRYSPFALHPIRISRQTGSRELNLESLRDGSARFRTYWKKITSSGDYTARAVCRGIIEVK